MLLRAVAGCGAAIIVASIACRAHSLSNSGGVAAAIVGTIAVSTGWSWGVALILYFVSSILLTRIGRDVKDQRTSSVLGNQGPRDAAQVLANGGLFALGALIASSLPSFAVVATAGAFGALAASAADSWATEVGMLAGGIPRSLHSFRPVAPGTSGGVSAAGTLAMTLGALFVALIAHEFGLVASFTAVFVGGIAGAVTDSLLGGTIQEKRWCDRCEHATERRVHDCGHLTTRTGGVALMDNDAVNFVSTLIGAAVAATMILS